ncbi:mariner Mos1 transposase [Trichonephila clavipes]|nr:mariner Mos1 transposase [Trichonephila clavipes]
MSAYEPNSRHLREVLMLCFNMKKSAAEAHRMLSNTYGEATISERTFREWFQRFKNGDFDVEDQHGIWTLEPLQDHAPHPLRSAPAFVEECLQAERIFISDRATQHEQGYRVVTKKERNIELMARRSRVRNHIHLAITVPDAAEDSPCREADDHLNYQDSELSIGVVGKFEDRSSSSLYLTEFQNYEVRCH